MFSKYRLKARITSTPLLPLQASAPPASTPILGLVHGTTWERLLLWYLTGTCCLPRLHEVLVSYHRTGCLTAHPFSVAPLDFAPVLAALTGPPLQTSLQC